MPSLPKSKAISAKEAFEAIRVLSTLATHATSHATGPKITYGPNTDAGQTPMTSDNAAPGLAIWLFLVTSQKFLDALDTPGDGTMVPISTMSDATNLSETSVNQILDQYRKKKGMKIPSNVKTYGDALVAVTALFQDYAASAGYTKTDCPGGPCAIQTLSSMGAVVNPCGS